MLYLGMSEEVISSPAPPPINQTNNFAALSPTREAKLKTHHSRIMICMKKNIEEIRFSCPRVCVEKYHCFTDFEFY